MKKEVVTKVDIDVVTNGALARVTNIDGTTHAKVFLNPKKGNIYDNIKKWVATVVTK